MKITKPAARVKQRELTIYAISLKVRELLIPGFFQVEKLDSIEGTGFQRVLEQARVKKLASYIIKAWEDNDAFLPTSIFLATDKDISYNESKNEITFDTSVVCPFNVVDGQHRVQGLIDAALQNPEIGEFEIMANIAVNLNEISQMCHFLIVNTTQKSVNKGVAQQIIARLSNMVSIEDVPTLPKWIQNQVNKGDDNEALIITNYLNTEKDSPLYKKITLANEKADSDNVKQDTFVNSIKKYILNSNNPVSGMEDRNKRNQILKNYWKAISELLENKESNKASVIYRTNGLELFNYVSTTVFNILFAEQDFRVNRIKENISKGFENINDDFADIQNPDYWVSGGGVTSLNVSKMRPIATDLSRAINVRSVTDNFDI